MSKDEALRAAVDEVMRHQWSNSHPAMQALTTLVDTAIEAADEIERLRAALAESEPEPTKFVCPSCGREYNVSHGCAKGAQLSVTDCTVTNTTPVSTESEQPIVAWWWRDIDGSHVQFDKPLHAARPLVEPTSKAAAAESEQEPVAWVRSELLASLKTYRFVTAILARKSDDKSVPLYASPVRAEPLTDEEIDEIADGPDGHDRFTFARAVERKVRSGT